MIRNTFFTIHASKRSIAGGTTPKAPFYMLRMFGIFPKERGGSTVQVEKKSSNAVKGTKT